MFFHFLFGRFLNRNGRFCLPEERGLWTFPLSVVPVLKSVPKSIKIAHKCFFISCSGAFWTGTGVFACRKREGFEPSLFRWCRCWKVSQKVSKSPINVFFISCSGAFWTRTGVFAYRKRGGFEPSLFRQARFGCFVVTAIFFRDQRWRAEPFPLPAVIGKS